MHIIGQVYNNFIYLKSVDSTNEYAKRNIDSIQNKSIVFTKEQTSGNGRFKRDWHSTKGKNLIFTIVLKPEISPSNLEKIAVLSVTSVLKGLIDIGKFPLNIKWPNDIMLNGKKLGGILIESGFKGDKIEYVIVGIGININEEKFPDEIIGKATSLKLFSHKNFNKEMILKSVLYNFFEYYDDFLLTVSLKKVLPLYKKYLINLNSKVIVKEKDECYIGFFQDILENGHVLITLNNGDTKEISSSNVSIRGINGYL